MASAAKFTECDIPISSQRIKRVFSSCAFCAKEIKDKKRKKNEIILINIIFSGEVKLQAKSIELEYYFQEYNEGN